MAARGNAFVESSTVGVATTTDRIANVLWAGGLVIDLQPGLATAEVERRLVLAMRAGELCNRALAFYLAELQERRLYQALGFPDAVEFARKRLGMGKSRAYQLLAVGRQLAELPRVDRAFARGELSWSKARCIARVAAPDTEQAWLERARPASQEQIEAMVSGCHKGDPPPNPGEGLPRSRFVVKVTLDAIGHEMLELAREKLQAELGRIVTDEELLREALALILSSDADGTVPGRKKVDGSRFRVVVQGALAGRDGRDAREPAQTAIPVSGPQLESLDSDARVGSRLRQRVLERDGYRCQACASRRDLMVHHVLWRSRGGRTAPSNLCTACSRCHGLLHDELLFVSGVPGRWEFTDRQGRPVDEPIAPPGVQLRVDSTMVDNPTSGHSPAAVRDSTMVDDPTSARGPAAVRDSTMVDDPTSGHSPAAVRDSTMVDDPTSGHSPAAVHDSTMVDNPTSARGPAPQPDTEEEPPLTNLDDIPDEIDAAWWRRHEKQLERTRPGRGVRLKKQRRSN